MRRAGLFLLALLAGSCGARTGVTSRRSGPTIAAGNGFTCALDRDGGTWCWGANHSSQLGDGTTIGSPRPVRGALFADAAGVYAGVGLTAVRTRDARLEQAGALLHSGVPMVRPSPVLDGIAEVAIGDAFMWTRLVSGKVIAEGTVPLGSYELHGEVAGIDDAVQIAVSDTHACAALSDGSAACWGGDTDGELGDGTTTTTITSAVRVVVTDEIARIAAGDGFTCAVRMDGSVVCWGGNHVGELGRPPTATGPAVVTVLDSGATDVCARASYACALLSAGVVTCWGATPDSAEPHAAPSVVAGLADVVEVACGWTHACARRASGELDCWGTGASGELGDGTTDGHLRPAPVLPF